MAMRFLVSMTAAICAGCTTATLQSYPASNEKRLALYAEATPCCDDPSGFPFAALPVRGYTDRVIDGSSPVFEFQSGLSPFAAFELPKSDVPYRVRVKSLFDARGGGELGVFYPVLVLMDDAYIVTHMTGLEHLRLEPALATAGGEPGLAVTVLIEPAGQGGRYLVVFTPAVLLGAEPGVRREGDLLTPAALAWQERHGATALPASPYGRLRITIAPDAQLAESRED